MAAEEAQTDSGGLMHAKRHQKGSSTVGRGMLFLVFPQQTPTSINTHVHFMKPQMYEYQVTSKCKILLQYEMI